MNVELTKIKAFTLAEMMVVLLLTTLVVGMAYSVLHLVQKQMAGIENNFENRTELNRLRQSLWTDLNRYEYAYYNARQHRIELSSEIKGITYELEEKFIVKERDTFFMSPEEWSFYFEDRGQSAGPIDALRLTTRENGGQTLFVWRNNTANTYMNQ